MSFEDSTSTVPIVERTQDVVSDRSVQNAERNTIDITRDMRNGFAAVRKASLNSHSLFRELFKEIKRIIGHFDYVVREKSTALVGKMSVETYNGDAINSLSNEIKKMLSVRERISKVVPTSIDILRQRINDVKELGEVMSRVVDKVDTKDSKVLQKRCAQLLVQIKELDESVGSKFVLAFFGAQNSGKSSVVNCILGQEVMMVGTGRMSKTIVIASERTSSTTHLYKISLKSTVSLEDVKKCLTSIDSYQDLVETKDRNVTAEDRVLFDMEKRHRGVIDQLLNAALRGPKEGNCAEINTNDMEVFKALSYGYFCSALVDNAVCYIEGLPFIVIDVPGTGSCDIDTTPMGSFIRGANLHVIVKSANDLSLKPEDTDNFKYLGKNNIDHCIVIANKKDMVVQSQMNAALENFNNLVHSINDTRLQIRGSAHNMPPTRGFFVTCKTMEDFNADPEVEEMQDHMSELLHGGLISRIYDELLIVFSSYSSLIEDVCQSHSGMIKRMLPHGVTTEEIASQNRSPEVEQKMRVFEHDRKQRAFSKKSEELKKKLNTMLSVNLRVSKAKVVNDSDNTFHREMETILKNRPDLLSAQSLTDFMLSEEGPGVGLSPTQAEIEYRKVKTIELEEIIELCTRKLANYLFENYAQVFLDTIQTQLNLDPETANELLMDEEVFGKAKFTTTVVALVMHRASALLEFYVLWSKNIQDNRVALESCKQDLLRMGVDVDKHDVQGAAQNLPNNASSSTTGLASSNNSTTAATNSDTTANTNSNNNNTQQTSTTTAANTTAQKVQTTGNNSSDEGKPSTAATSSSSSSPLVGINRQTSGVADQSKQQQMTSSSALEKEEKKDEASSSSQQGNTTEEEPKKRKSGLQSLSRGSTPLSSNKM